MGCNCGRSKVKARQDQQERQRAAAEARAARRAGGTWKGPKTATKTDQNQT